MSYKITSLYKFPHGHAVAVCLPEIWEYMIDNMDKCIDKRGSVYLLEIFDSIANAMAAEDPKVAVAIFRDMMKRMELSNPRSENKDDDLKVLSTSVNPVRLKNNPASLDIDAIESLYGNIVSDLELGHFYIPVQMNKPNNCNKN